MLWLGYLDLFYMNLILSNIRNYSIILFTDGEMTELQFGRDVLLPVAEEYLLEHSEEGGLALQFFVAGEVCQRLKEWGVMAELLKKLWWRE